ncbi:MAG: hypothetical protein M1813_006901 [Trichoglossum hirsutum]|nr:MAG: hypothetical protein M1813_006901 [Trichoglossum hirsutum]
MRASHSIPTPLSTAQSQRDFDLPMPRPMDGPGASRAPSSGRSIHDYRGEAKMTFGGTIEGLRPGQYSCVNVLFVTWEGDDMNCLQEVEPLKQVFEGQFRFRTGSYQIPSERPIQSLNQELTALVNEMPPGSLTIFYYGGHGYRGEETKKLKFAAKATPFAKGDSTIFYQDILDTLKHLDGDLLVILDTCYAGKATYHHKLRGRIELLAATAHDRMAAGPLRKGSFTPALVEKLGLLLKEDPHGFLVSDLFAALDYDDDLKIKPRWYPQSDRDYGRIFLCPQRERRDGSTEATLHLCLSIAEPPDARVLNDIANGLRLVPHVHKITVGDLNAPDETIKELRLMINVAHMVRNWARRARKILEGKKGYALEHAKPLAVHDWSQAASFKLESDKEMAPVRIRRFCPSPNPEEPFAAQTTMDRPPPEILLGEPDAPSADDIHTAPDGLNGLSNPYSLLADTSDTSVNSSIHLSPTFHSSRENERSSASDIGDDRPATSKKKRRSRRTRKKNRCEDIPETHRTWAYSYGIPVSVTVTVLLLLYVCANVARPTVSKAS